jgi:hypothetical protein
MSEKKQRKESIVEIVALPTLAAGAGSLIGGIAGGAATRKILSTPGVKSSSTLCTLLGQERRALHLR